ncbi:hypothetical protein [Rhodococcus wratislaviensis]
MSTTQAPAVEERRSRKSREPGEFLRLYLQRDPQSRPRRHRRQA